MISARKVSVVVPAYEHFDRGVEFLDDLFRTISVQTLKEVEIIVSDHSTEDNVEKFCALNEYNLNIKYIRNKEKRGNPCANTNVAINHATGDVVKVFFQDDFLYDTTALEKIYHELMSSESMWLVNGCIHTKDDGHSFFHPINPRWDSNMILSPGCNFIGAPSVVSFKKESKIRFDENVAMLMDVDFYYNMFLTYGHPIYLNDTLIGNRVREDTWQKTITQEEVDKEFKYVHIKYGIKK